MIGRKGRSLGEILLIAALLFTLIPSPSFAAGDDVVIPDGAMKVDGEAAVSGNIGYDANGQDGAYAWIDHNSSDSSIAYSVTVDAAGTYDFAFRYTAGTVNTAQDRTLAVDVNGQAGAASLVLPDTGTWNTWNTVVLPLELVAGANTVTLRAEAAGNGMCLDYFHVWLVSESDGGTGGEEGTGGGETPSARYEAESADFNRASVFSSVYASGSQYVGQIDYEDSFVQFDSVTVEEDGAYELEIGYANGTTGTSTHSIQVNGIGSGTAVYPVTGGWMNTVPYVNFHQTVSVTVTLEAGTNTIRFTKGSGYAELDYIEVVGEVEEIGVQSVTIEEPDQTELTVNDSLQLQAVIAPEEATNKQIVWSVANSDSSATPRASIDQNGLVTGLAAGGVLVSVTSVDNPEATDTIELTIVEEAPLTVDLADRYRPVTHVASGALYGLAEEGRPADSLIAPIKPKMFTQMAPEGGQLPNGESTPIGDALKVADIADRNGATVTIRMPDIYPNFPYQWVSWDDWYSKVEAMVSARLESEADNIYAYELWNEPDWTWDTANAGSFLEGWEKTYDKVRELDSDTPIMGPSYSIFNETWIRSFLSYCKENGCLPDIISWHELGDYLGVPNPQNIQARIAVYRQIEEELGIDPLPISINEYMAYSEDTIPGHTIQYIAQFERGGVDTANTAFWFRPGRLSNIVTDTGKANGSWWMFKWYGDMSGEMAMTVPAQTDSMGLDGIASVDEDTDAVHVVFGGASGDREVVVKGFESEGLSYSGKAYVKAEATPWYGVDTEVDEPTLLFAGEFDIVNGEIAVPISGMNDIWAYHLVITPVAQTADTRYESEHATVNRAGVFENDNASNGKYVGQIDYADSYVEYSVQAPSAGEYELTIGYANGTENVSTQELTVNGVAEGTVAYEPTGGWTWSGLTGTAIASVSLNVGANTIRLTKGEAGGYAELDYIQLTTIGAFEQRLEAENAVINDAQVFTGSYASDFRYVGYINNAASSLLFSPVVPEAGTYELEIGYGNGTDTVSTHTLTVNGTDSVVSYAPSGGWINAYANKGNRKTVTVEVDLQAGANTIKLTKKDGYAELDYIKIAALEEETTDPGTTDPGTTDPETTNPGTTDPETTDPGTTDPGTTNPGTSGSGSSSPDTTSDNGAGVGPTGAISVKAGTDASGTANVAVDPDLLRKAIQLSGNGPLTLTITGTEEATRLVIAIPADPIRDGGAAISAIEIDAGWATFSIDLDVLLGAGEVDTYQLTIAKRPLSEFSADVQARLGNAIVYDITLTADGRNLSSFEPGSVTVSLTYELQPGEKAENVVIYYVTEAGELQIVANAWYDAASGRVVFRPAHLSMYAPAYASVRFSDVDASHWANSAIEAMAARGIVQGDGEGNFYPQAQVTRAEFIQMAARAFEWGDSRTAASFKDVSPSDWYYDAVASAASLGIVTGRPDGFFGAADPISRQEMAVILFRIAEFSGIALDDGTSGVSSEAAFTDSDAVAGYAAEAVTNMAKSGILQGTGNGQFEPQAAATRAEAAVIIYRLFVQSAVGQS